MTSAPGTLRANEPGATPGNRTFRWRLALLVAAVAVLYVVTLRPGQPWNDDFAMYLLHARNLLEGRPYIDTGFIHNPADPYYSPRVYPPAFPLLLAPLLALFGTDMFVLRMVVVASAAGAVAVLALLIRPVLGDRLALAAAALLGFQPFLVRFKNLLLPDFTFVLFVLLTLYLVRDLHKRQTTDHASMAKGVLAGLCMYFTLALRAAGMALPGALVLYHVLQRRLPTVPLVLCLATAAVLYGAQIIALPRDVGYAAQYTEFRETRDRYLASSDSAWADRLSPYAAPEQNPVRRLVGRVLHLVVVTDVLWASSGELFAPPVHGVGKLAIFGLMLLAGGLALIGYIISLRRLSVVETFVPAYAGLLVAWWGIPDGRYLVPLFPFLFYYMVRGLAVVASLGSRYRIAAAAAAVFIAASYVINLTRVDRSPYETGAANDDAEAVFDFIRTCTPPTARVLAQWPRAVALYTGRDATRMLPALLEDNGADHLASAATAMDVDYVLAFRETRLDELAVSGTDFTTVYASDRYLVFRYVAAGPPAPVVGGNTVCVSDRSRNSGQ
ncbi:hypothetical protein BH23GEM9_BH23GEM9_08600 [soil metagenome]